MDKSSISGSSGSSGSRAAQQATADTQPHQTNTASKKKKNPLRSALDNIAKGLGVNNLGKALGLHKPASSSGPFVPSFDKVWYKPPPNIKGDRPDDLSNLRNDRQRQIPDQQVRRQQVSTQQPLNELDKLKRTCQELKDVQIPRAEKAYAEAVKLGTSSAFKPGDGPKITKAAKNLQGLHSQLEEVKGTINEKTAQASQLPRAQLRPTSAHQRSPEARGGQSSQQSSAVAAVPLSSVSRRATRQLTADADEKPSPLRRVHLPPISERQPLLSSEDQLLKPPSAGAASVSSPEREVLERGLSALGRQPSTKMKTPPLENKHLEMVGNTLELFGLDKESINTETLKEIVDGVLLKDPGWLIAMAEKFPNGVDDQGNVSARVADYTLSAIKRAVQ
jgi:hypothetical protein